MYKIKKQFIMLIFFLFVIIAFINTVSADQSIIYVNDSGGNDSWNGEATTWDGSTLLGPKKSIKNATGTVTENGTVNIANGVYNGTGNTNIAIYKNVAIVGESQTGTIINGTNTYQLFNIWSGVNALLVNLTLTNANNNFDSVIYNGGNLTAFNCNFTDNSKFTDGMRLNGGVINNQNILYVFNCYFDGNHGEGGAIYNSGTLYLDNSTFTDNSADWNGGAICNNVDSMLYIVNSTFTNNTANWSGGAIYNNVDSMLYIVNSTFTNNTALNGGAIYTEYATLFAIDSIFTKNAAEWGGAIQNGGIWGNLTFVGCNFTSNTANYGGGAISNKNAFLTVYICNFAHNAVTTEISSDFYGHGGAIYSRSDDPYTAVNIILSSIFTNNTAKTGGAISNNGVYQGSGAILSGYNELIMNFCQIVGNTPQDIFNNNDCSADLPYNWWGSNNGPTSGRVIGDAIFTPWLILTVNVNPTLININGTSAIIVDLLHDSNGTYHDPAEGYFPDRVPMNFTTTLGTITNPAYTINGTVQSILNGGPVSGIANVSIKLDNQTLQKTINVYDTVTIAQIKQAATIVRNYVETQRKLPNTVQIGSYDVTMPQFLELLTTALLQINSGNNDLIYLKNFSAPINPTENIHTGNIYKSEYMKLASDIKNYMDSTGKTPDYAYGTSIGPKLRFENLVYMYAMILDYYNTSGNIAGWAAMEPWSDITSRPVIDPNAPKFTVAQIEIAASTLRTYVETYHNLPNTISVGSTDVSMSQFLELLTTTLLQINNGNNNQISLRNFTDPVNPKESIRTGNIYKAEYMKLASDIKNYMDSTGKTPGYAYGTSIGSYLRFENLVYMYAMILDYHRTSGNIAGWAAMEPWSDITSRPVIDPNAPKFTVDQIKTAAITVYKNVENVHNLPDKVTINGTDVSMHQFLELLTTVLLQINNGNNNTIILRNFTAPVNPTEDINMGIIYKAEYMKLASDIKNYMDNTGKTPDYAYGTSIGPKLRFENIVYMYSTILDYQNRTGIMPVGVLMAPWSMIISIPIVDPNAPKFTVDQIKIAASTVRHEIETFHKLPVKVTINGTDVKMPQFLELLTTALIHICSGNSSAMPLMNFTAPTNPKEIIWPGNIYQEDYVQMAVKIKYYMDSTGKTPDYAYDTSIGPYLRYENLVYMYTMILDYYNTSGRLADWAEMKPWAMI